jgi:soluble lytic murein transglycosylase-like protein
MAALSVLVAGFLLTATATPPGAPWHDEITQASERFAIPAPWIRSVIRAESNGMTHLHGVPIRSPKGAIGLMQLMPGTWAEMRQRYHLGGNPDDPHDNIMAGTAYLALLLPRFGYPGLFAAYNAGPARFSAVLQGTAMLPEETIAYQRGITSGLAAEPGHDIAPVARPGLFFINTGVPSALPGRVPDHGLFF